MLVHRFLHLPELGLPGPTWHRRIQLNKLGKPEIAEKKAAAAALRAQKAIEVASRRQQRADTALQKVTITISHGLPCFHLILECFKNGGQILPQDIHPFWWYDSTKAVSKTVLPILKPILEPVIVRGKGRPKGLKGISSKGNGRNDVTTGMY
jgi:hypothetical protein